MSKSGKPAPTKRRSPKSARTEINWRNEDVTRRMLAGVKEHLMLDEDQFGWLIDQHYGWLVDLNTRLHKVESYLWGAPAAQGRAGRLITLPEIPAPKGTCGVRDARIPNNFVGARCTFKARHKGPHSWERKK